MKGQQLVYGVYDNNNRLSILTVSRHCLERRGETDLLRVQARVLHDLIKVRWALLAIFSHLGVHLITVCLSPEIFYQVSRLQS